jgi:hypothetical protein
MIPVKLTELQIVFWERLILRFETKKPPFRLQQVVECLRPDPLASRTSDNSAVD